MATQSSTTYRIVIQAAIEPGWSVWFEGMELAAGPGGTTTLSGPVVDQAALHGLLAKIRDLGLPLVSIQDVTHAAPGE
jgi:hypothetical protein